MKRRFTLMMMTAMLMGSILMPAMPAGAGTDELFIPSGCEDAFESATKGSGPYANHEIVFVDELRFYGGASGSQLIIGTGGADEIHGGSGNDTLIGGQDDDTLYGDSGSDTLIGGETPTTDNGTDSCIGGTGGDTFSDGCETIED